MMMAPGTARRSSATIAIKPALASNAAGAFKSPSVTSVSALAATMPASFISPTSASDSPLSPLEMAPTGCTRTAPTSRARRTIRSVTERQSLTGLVLGMQQMVVNPPAAAASVPEAMSSLYSWPGSRRCTCRSTKPGVTILPAQSITRAPGAVAPGSTAAMAPSLIKMSVVRSRS